MREDSLLNPTIETEEEVTLRPKHLDEFIGQDRVRERLEISLDAARKEKRPLDHVLFSGPPGLGKTTLAGVIANELEVKMRVTSGPALDRPGDLAAILSNLDTGDVFFIDEIHRLPRAVEEVLYPAMEDFQLDIVLGKGPTAQSIRLDLPRFTLVGATTRKGTVTAPLRDRFGIEEKLDYYSPDELAVIIRRSAGIIGVEISEDAAGIISHRSRSTPRIANRLLARVRDYAVSRASGVIDPEVADEALRVFEVDDLGLDKVDRAILESIIDKFGGGPVGLSTLAIAVGEEPETVEDAYEPFLLQSGLIKRTPTGPDGNRPCLHPSWPGATRRLAGDTALASLFDAGRVLQVSTPGVGCCPGGDRAPPRLSFARHAGYVRSSFPGSALTAPARRPGRGQRNPGAGSPTEWPPTRHRRFGRATRPRSPPGRLVEALARPSRRLRPGLEIEMEGIEASVVEGPEDGLVVVDLRAADVEEAIAAAGKIPLPPYFHGTLGDPDRYQTMFARSTGSAAAPTAGLHFTPEVAAGLRGREIEIAPVDLHVGIDTFRPITADELEHHVMHSEWCSIPATTAAAISRTRAAGGRIVAVGTTVVRTLETFATDDRRVIAGNGETDLFLRPGDEFRVVDALVTNFHVPGSTLVVLVAAFMGERWRRAYQTALDRGYRFLSFGDAMYAER